MPSRGRAPARPSGDRATKDQACAQVYGGPQHARITGTVAGRKVDLTVTRTDGCGIRDWDRLEWLLGPPGG